MVRRSGGGGFAVVGVRAARSLFGAGEICNEMTDMLLFNIYGNL